MNIIQGNLMGTDILKMRHVETNPAVSIGVILLQGQGGMNLSFQVLLKQDYLGSPFASTLRHNAPKPSLRPQPFDLQRFGEP